MAFFIALAFADEVFQDASTPEELLEMYRDVEVNKPRRIEFKPEKLSEPIFKGREFGRNNSCSGRGVLDYYSFWEMLRDLSFRAGYSRHLRPYSIRYGSANKLYGKH